VKFRVIGANIVKYIGNVTVGHNCNFTEEKQPLEKYEILLKSTKNEWYYKLTLHEEHGECGSGWTTASWGHANLTRIANPFPHNLKPKEETTIALPTKTDLTDDFTCDLFSWSYQNDDPYYPSGYVNFNKSNWFPIRNILQIEDIKRYVHIFQGTSGLGKSYLANLIQGKSVYETDSNDTLPDIINEDIIVLGNKYPFTIEEVKARINGSVPTKIITVTFKG